MKKLVLLSFLFCSCKNEKEKQILSINTAFKKQIVNHAFKNNYSINILELKLLKLDTINENFIDTIHLRSNNKKIQKFSELSESVLAKCKSETKLAQLYSNLRSITLFNYYRDKARESLAEALSYKD